MAPKTNVEKELTDHYGASQRYVGAAGEQYFSGQKTGGMLSVQWNLKFWLPYIQETDSILDFGCGGGYLLSALPGVLKTGVEINPAARREAEQMGLSVFPTINDLPMGQKFDCVISNHALEHIPRPLDALKALKQRLKPEGRLLMMLPLDDWRARYHKQYHANDYHFHLYGWTPQNLGNLLSEAGFIPQNIKIITDAMPPLRLAQKIAAFSRVRSLSGKLTSMALKRRQLFACAIQAVQEQDTQGAI